MCVWQRNMSESHLRCIRSNVDWLPPSFRDHLLGITKPEPVRYVGSLRIFVHGVGPFSGQRAM